MCTFTSEHHPTEKYVCEIDGIIEDSPTRVINQSGVILHVWKIPSYTLKSMTTVIYVDNIQVRLAGFWKPATYSNIDVLFPAFATCWWIENWGCPSFNNQKMGDHQLHTTYNGPGLFKKTRDDMIRRGV